VNTVMNLRVPWSRQIFSDELSDAGYLIRGLFMYLNPHWCFVVTVHFKSRSSGLWRRVIFCLLKQFTSRQ
jgi:hypothetical protein